MQDHCFYCSAYTLKVHPAPKPGALVQEHKPKGGSLTVTCWGSLQTEFVNSKYPPYVQIQLIMDWVHISASVMHELSLCRVLLWCLDSVRVW